MVVVVDQHWPTKKTSYNCGISQGLCAWTLWFSVTCCWTNMPHLPPEWSASRSVCMACKSSMISEQNRPDADFQLSRPTFSTGAKVGSPVTQPLGPWVKGIRPVSSWIALPPPRNAPAGAWSACQCKGRYRRWYPGRFRAGLPTHMDTLLYHFHIFTCVMYIILINLYIYIHMCVCASIL